MYNDTINDHTLLTEKIYISSGIRLFRLVSQILFIAYLVGQYWYTFCWLLYEIKKEQYGSAFADVSFLENEFGAGSISDFEPGKKALTCMYFALTTLTTVGFGDYYPISNIERLVWSFMMLFGVMTSNFIMGELLNMMDTVESIEPNF